MTCQNEIDVALVGFGAGSINRARVFHSNRNHPSNLQLSTRSQRHYRVYRSICTSW